MSDPSRINPNQHQHIDAHSTQRKPEHLQKAHQEDIQHFDKQIHGQPPKTEDNASFISPHELMKQNATQHNVNVQPPNLSFKNVPPEIREKLEAVLNQIKSTPKPDGNQASIQFDSNVLPDTVLHVKHNNGKTDMRFETSSNEALAFLDQAKESLMSTLTHQLGVPNLHMQFESAAMQKEQVKELSGKISQQLNETISKHAESKTAWAEEVNVQLADNMPEIKLSIKGDANNVAVTLPPPGNIDSSMLTSIMNELQQQISSQLGSQKNVSVAFDDKN